MQYDKYADQLLAQQDRIPIAAAIDLLLGYPLHILEDINREYLNSGCTNRRDAAKNLAHSAPDKSEADYLRLLHASAALSLFKKWLNLKFHNGEPWFAPAEKYQTRVLFDWIYADKIIDRLEREIDGFKAPDRAYEFIGYMKEESKEATPPAQTEPGQPEPEREPPAEVKSDPFDSDVFVKGLTFYFADPCVFIIAPNKRPTPYTLPSMGFAMPSGVTAQDFISILMNSIGPYYSLGPSHSRVGAQGKNIADIGTDGKYVPESMENEGDKSEGSRVSTGMRIVADDEAQKTEIPEYRAKMERLKVINNKIRHFLEKEFGVDLGKGFKLYKNVPERGNGEYRFNFQTKMFKSVSADCFSGMDKPMILEKLATLSNMGDDESLSEYMAIFNHAIKRGISEDEIDNQINFRKDQEK